MRNNNFAPLNNMAHWKEQNLVLWSRHPKMWRPHMWTPGPFWIVSKLHRSKVYRQAHIRTLTWFNYWTNRLQLTMSLWQNKDSAHWTHQYFLSKGLRTMTCSHMLGQVSSIQTKACRYKDVSWVSERRPKLSGTNQRSSCHELETAATPVWPTTLEPVLHRHGLRRCPLWNPHHAAVWAKVFWSEETKTESFG